MTSWISIDNYSLSLALPYKKWFSDSSALAWSQKTKQLIFHDLFIFRFIIGNYGVYSAQKMGYIDFFFFSPFSYSIRTSVQGNMPELRYNEQETKKNPLFPRKYRKLNNRWFMLMDLSTELWELKIFLHYSFVNCQT